MWNLKNKTNEQTKLNRNSIINKKNKQAVARGKEVGEEEKLVRETTKYKLSVTKQMSHRYEMYSVGNTFNSYVTSFV